MPHDAKGNLLQPGDKVILRGTVKQVHAGEEYCNAEIELDIPMPPYIVKTSISAINTRQVEKVEEVPDLPANAV